MTEFPRNKARYDGHHSECRACAHTRYWRNPAHARDLSLSYKFGIKPGTYAKMLAAQSGKCAICGATANGKRTRFHIDHNHVDNKIRGLLCTCCNQGIGGLRDNPALLRLAADYLEAHQA